MSPAPKTTRTGAANGGGTPPVSAAELSAIASVVDETARRLAALGDAENCPEEIQRDLYESERHMKNALRRLTHAVEQL